MTINELIRQLEALRDKHGNLPIYRYYDGYEFDPDIVVSDTKTDYDERQFFIDVPAEKRVLIK